MGGGSKKVTVGYKYYLGIHMVNCHGDADGVLRIRVDDRDAWIGFVSNGSIYINQPNLFGGETREGGIVGVVDVASGSQTQGQNDYLAGKLGSDVPAFRGVAALILRQVYMGMNPYIKRWASMVQRIHKKSNGATQWYDAKAAIVSGATLAAPSYVGYLNHPVTTTGQLGWTSGPIPPMTGTDESIGQYITDERNRLYIIEWGPNAQQMHMEYADYNPGNNTVYAYGNDQNNSYPPGTFIASVSGVYMACDNGGTGTWSLGASGVVGQGIVTCSPVNSTIYDMNPAHIIRECLTDSAWGMGYQDSDIDDVSFMAAADTLYNEAMGISMIWDRQTRIEDFIQEVIKHIYATLYVDRTTGKFVLKLIRNDYVFASLPQLDESNISKIESYSRPSFGDLVNSVTVNYLDTLTNKTQSITVQDTALVQLQGSVIGTTVQYPGFSNYDIAARAAQRDLISLSTPLLTCQLTADRTVSHLNVGSVFKLYWPDFSDDVIPMRITGIAFGDGRSNRIRITCMQDIFVIPETVIVQQQTSGWVDPSQPPGPSPYHKAFEAPYIELVQQLGQTNTTNLLTSNPDAGYMLAACSRPVGGINAIVNIESSGVYIQGCMVDFSPAGELASAISYNDTSITLNNSKDLDLVQTGWWGLLGDEIINITNVTGDVLTIGRGVLDTVPAPHSVGTQLLICDMYAETDGVEYVYSETLNVKIQTISGQGSLDIADAPIDTFTFNSRAIRPYAPGKFLINDQAYPESIIAEAIVISWAHRDRVQQTAGVLIDTTAGNIGPEAGTTYTVEIREGGVLIESASGITGTSYSASVTGDKTIEITLYSMRDSYKSWQSHVHVLTMGAAIYKLVENGEMRIDETGNLMRQE